DGGGAGREGGGCFWGRSGYSARGPAFGIAGPAVVSIQPVGGSLGTVTERPGMEFYPMYGMRLPLTPALSPYEGAREKRRPTCFEAERVRNSSRVHYAVRRRTSLPLPLQGGAGRAA